LVKHSNEGKIMHRALSKAPFVAAVFLAGGVLGALEVPPFPILKEGFNASLKIVEQNFAEHPSLLAKSPFREHGLIVNDTSRISPGLTLIQGWLPGGPQVRLIESDGTELHRWDLDFFEIWHEPEHIFPRSEIPNSDVNFHTQGFWPHEDGSILANIGNRGSVLLDKCSEPIWTVDRMTHHSVTYTEDGNYWIPSNISLLDTPAKYFPRGKSLEELIALRDSRLNNSIVLVNGDGEVEKEFSILAAFFEAGLEHALFSSMQDRIMDPTHVNDVEVVTAALADKIDDVETGDLLVSVRQMHMLIILDKNDGHLKWFQQGPWVRQHDPDITDEGTIEVYNNRPKAIGRHVDNSEIMSFDPSTGQTTVLHPVGEEDSFYSRIMGTHQRLENGNILVTVSTAGQMLEFTQEGEVVWDYRLPFNENVQSLFEEGMRIPSDFFDVDSWLCN
jgi:hypothetical protein